MDDYIGGRYSSTSAVGGAVLSLAFGPEVFAQFLDGAAAEDKLSKNADIMENPEMLDALIGVYERNVLGYPSTAVLPYSQALSRFPAHLQQADMESNGKSVNRFGEPVDYVTGPVIFGEPGTNGQHSFYQLLHQGTDIVPLQFIGFKNNQLDTDVVIQDSTSQQKLCANVAAQIVAFACGKADDNKNKNFEGGRPSSIARKMAPALLTGNTIVIKPSEFTPNNAIAFAKIVDEIGLPRGVFNLVLGRGETVGQELAGNPKVAMVSMTGSVSAGEKIMATAAKNITKVCLELGGKAPAIVMDDADLELAVKAIVDSRVINSGQVCNCAERVYAGRRTQNEKTLHADLVLAGITQLITVVLSDKINHHEFIRSLKPLIA